MHLLGLSEELPINCADTLDLIERMVLRAAMLRGGTCGTHYELKAKASSYNQPIKRQTHVKHTQTTLRLLPTNFLSVFDYFVGLAINSFMADAVII